MAKEERKPRDTDEFEEEGLLLTPFDVRQLGTDDDPCFGKLYDLKAEECKVCGDIEVCAIAFSQKLTLKRLEIESEGSFKDLDEAKFRSGDNGVKQFVVGEIIKGTPKIIIIREGMKKFNVSREIIKQNF